MAKRWVPGVVQAALSAWVLAGSPAVAQTPPGNSNTGESLWNANGCSGCHTLTKIRGDITARTPAGMSFDKALAALNAALAGTDLDGNVTGMNTLFGASLTTANRNDLAAYIAGLAGPAPIISYSPSGGAIFPATAVGASSSATVTIRNTGTAPLTFQTNNAVTIASGGDAADFRVSSSTCPAATLQPNSGSCTISLTFTPAAGAALTRSASAGLATTTGTSLVPLTGTVSAPTTAPPTSAANPPADGGGGALHALWLLLGAAGAVRRRSAHRRCEARCARDPAWVRSTRAAVRSDRPSAACPQPFKSKAARPFKLSRRRGRGTWSTTTR